MKELINKFLEGEITDSELEQLKVWLEKEPANRRIFDEENEIWQESGCKLINDNFKTDKGWNDLSKVLELAKNPVKPVIVFKKRSYTLLMAAASLAFIIAIGSLTLWSINKNKSIIPQSLTSRIETFEGEKAHVMLPDSTHIIMNSGTIVEYSSDFNIKERNINLTGEAFFNIQKNSQKPFNVILEKMVITATGTRFNVLSYKNENRIETTLEEGSININIPGNDPIIVKPGQQVIYFTKTNKTIIKDVVTETYTSWTENKLRLKDTPFEEALRRIGRRYNVVFEIRSPELLELKYTATFIDESIEDVMHLLKTVSPINYKIINRTTVTDAKYVKPKILVEQRSSRN